MPTGIKMDYRSISEMWFNQVLMGVNNSGKFVGVNMTEGIIEHFRQYHQDPDCESMEQFSPSKYGKWHMVGKHGNITYNNQLRYCTKLLQF